MNTRKKLWKRVSRILSPVRDRLKSEKGVRMSGNGEGKLCHFEPVRRPSLQSASTLDLLHELAARLQSQEVFPSTEEGCSIGRHLQQKLAEVTDVHLNRFSNRRLLDYYHAFLTATAAGRPPIKDAVWVELGSGALNPFAFLFLVLILGASRCIAVDLEEVRDWKAAVSILSDIAAGMLIDSTTLTPNDSLHPVAVLDRLKSFDLRKLRAGDRTGIDENRLMYLCEPAEKLSLADSSVDVVLSNSFLEHVRDIDGIAKEMHRITHAGGWGIHGIDGCDHRRYVDPEVHPLAFLEIDSKEPIVHYCNRIRPMMIGAIFERYGFEILEQEVWGKSEVTPEMRTRYAEPFRSMSQEYLEVTNLRLTVRKV